MTDDQAVEAMMAAAQALTDKAKSDPAIAQALLADPDALISHLLGRPLPGGAVFGATRGEDGEIELSLDMDATAAPQPRGGFLVEGLSMSGDLPETR